MFTYVFTYVLTYIYIFVQVNAYYYFVGSPGNKLCSSRFC